ncbi:16S rRNA (cytidine(1402)-2'-O)-methyltransferase [Legionella impletisoli]|uniref:Ribosomal RNA small subunit methyltransferase I n=1 Tax=Legionella impletisoli TaxID=343510 RepID=A0A917NBR2_9GAMM|nr:16S rRNA (cytidine(1402)-2'-O)-methyltransferase [Legionella impletisoli]GGI86965.1 ribosomal RNA small subunit methyltransferase I [Legionella impletisoli]
MTASSAITPGTLYIVATPIGNLEDISKRAIDTLQAVDVILAEDTRHSQPLLTALGIKKPLVSLHAFNEAEKSKVIIEQLQQGQSYALISDAGTPLISDPGYPLVKLAREEDISVVPIPGPCALISALSAAGVPTDVFTFAGFLPAKSSARKQALQKYSKTLHTLVFYESTHRIVDCLSDIADIFGESCELVLAKELTKTFERFVTGSCLEVKNWLLSDKGHVRGEFVLIIPPRLAKKDIQEEETLLTHLMEEMPLKQAVKLACNITGKNKNELYDLALRLNKEKKN